MEMRMVCTSMNFYPRSPCGERLHYDNYNLHCLEISIHALLAESDSTTITITYIVLKFLSTLSLRRATCCGCFARCRFWISIHALLAESDQQQHYKRVQRTNFYPRSPCGERPSLPTILTLNSPFLSTLSLRRATGREAASCKELEISIHALLAESDRCELHQSP